MGNWHSTTPQRPGAVPSIKDLFKAVKNNDYEDLKASKETVSLAKVQNENNGDTLLHEAVVRGNVAMVTWLLDEGCSGLAVDKSRETPLHCAVHLGKLEIVEILVQKFPKVLTKTNLWGRTPLTKSLASQRDDICRVLVASGDKVQLDLVDNFGQSPLILAASNGHLDIVELLIENGGDKNIRDTKGRTACYFAILHRFDRIFDRLLRCPSKFNLELYIAIETGHLYATMQLIDNGYTVNTVDKPCQFILDSIRQLATYITSKRAMSFERYSIADTLVTAYGHKVEIHHLLQIHQQMDFRQYPVLNKLMFKILLNSADVITNSRTLFGDMRHLCHKRSEVIKLKYLSCSAARRMISSLNVEGNSSWDFPNFLFCSPRTDSNLIYKCNKLDIPETFKNIILMRNI